ncbi:hypothetical protein [Flavobacterium sp.]|jgi:hypothetical protein|uniref:hypothetical protein n=1 Tax=Flavobacterium sp. TaxID=239 RepID=UPI0037C16B19
MTKYIFILYFLIFDYQSVFACKCESIDDIKTEFNSTDVVVRGKVISKEYVAFISTLNKKGLKKINSNNALDIDKKQLLKNNDILKIGIELLYTYKGKRLKKNIFIYTSRHSGACGYIDFKVGQEYQVYLSKDCYFGFNHKHANLDASSYNGFWTNICTRTKQFSSEEDKQLKKLMN